MEKKANKARIKATFFIFFFLFFPQLAKSASLYFSPSAGTYAVGDRITVNIVVSGDTPVNAVSGMIFFPISSFLLESISRSGSIVNFWVKDPSFSKSEGTVTFEGVMTAPFQGDNGRVISVVLKAIKEGIAKAEIKEGQILANDGHGTDVTGSLGSASFTIIPAKSVPKTVDPQPEGETGQEEAENNLTSPIISLSMHEGAQSVAGETSYSKADVVVTFLSESGSKIFVSEITDESGGFNIVIPKSLKEGVYTVNAAVIVGEKQSSPSNTIQVKVRISIFSIVLSFLVLFLAIPILFVSRRHLSKKVEEKVRKEVKEAESELEKSLEKVREDISKPMPDIKKVLDDINSSEKAVKKEIKDIESAEIGNGVG